VAAAVAEGLRYCSLVKGRQHVDPNMLDGLHELGSDWNAIKADAHFFS
jgi:hypothetical protein